MAERAEFLRLCKEGDELLGRAMDQDQFSQTEEAINFYIKVFIIIIYTSFSLCICIFLILILYFYCYLLLGC